MEYKEGYMNNIYIYCIIDSPSILFSGSVVVSVTVIKIKSNKNLKSHNQRPPQDHKRAQSYYSSNKRNDKRERIVYSVYSLYSFCRQLDQLKRQTLKPYYLLILKIN